MTDRDPLFLTGQNLLSCLLHKPRMRNNTVQGTGKEPRPQATILPLSPTYSHHSVASCQIRIDRVQAQQEMSRVTGKNPESRCAPARLERAN